MHYQYPIERIARNLHASCQARFAAVASQLLPKRDDVLYEPSTEGLRILAGDECALASPVEILQLAYGDEVTITAPRVRFQHDALGVKEPVMSLRVSVPVQAAPKVVDSLKRREAVLQEVDPQQLRSVIRAQAPLRKLLGYPQDLDELTANTADLWMWLSHYAEAPNGAQ